MPGPTRDPASARVHLVVGPVGAGKSTYARALALEHAALHLNLDDWMATLFRPDRPDRPDGGIMEWYVERTERCIEQIWKTTQGLLRVGTDVVLEIGLIQRRDREALYWRAKQQGCQLSIHVLDAPREVRRQRVQQRNEHRGETFAMEVPPAVFELASDMWEPLSPAECEGRDVRLISTE